MDICSVNKADPNGTHLQGYLSTSYSRLIETLGDPIFGGRGGWIVEFSDGKIATVYNWKNGYNYCGIDGRDVKDITEWNVGGMDSSVVSRMTSLVS
jgi:hypothetical protein